MFAVTLLRSAHPVDLARIAAACAMTSQKLYVQLTDPFPSSLRAAHLRVASLYKAVHKCNPHLDVRVLLPGEGYEFAAGANDIETVIGADDTSLDEFNQRRVSIGLPPAKFCKLDARKCESVNTEDDAAGADVTEDTAQVGCVVLGGTFDRMHLAHKLLLSRSCMLASRRIVCGVSDDQLLVKKTLQEILQPLNERIHHVVDFIRSIKPNLERVVVPISDPFGPSITDPDMQCVVVSEETREGGKAINDKRETAGLNQLVIDVISLEPHAEVVDEKVSSTWARKQDLGRNLSADAHVGTEGAWCRRTSADMPYCVCVAGGIACGKSTAAKTLCEMSGAGFINCDLLGHEAYKPGSATLKRLVERFGAEIVNEDGTVNRPALGKIVFSDPAALKALNEIVWPAIVELALAQRQEMAERGVKLCVVEGAVMLNDPIWRPLFDEAWAVVAPEAEAVKRLKDRNNFDEEEALKRIRSQFSAAEYARRADVVISTLWDKSETELQLSCGLEGLRLRMQSSSEPPVPGSLRAQWHAIAESIGLSPNVATVWWRTIRDAYCEPHRRYHTLTHIKAMMTTIQTYRTSFANPLIAQLATFFHDIIYDSTSANNEEESALLFEKFATEAATTLSAEDVAQISKFIRCTATHLSNTDHEQGDLALFLDADLAILGSDPLTYWRYAEGVRFEYKHIGDANFNSKRSEFLRTILKRDRLFFSEGMFEKFEKQARSNLENEILWLTWRPESAQQGVAA